MRKVLYFFSAMKLYLLLLLVLAVFFVNKEQEVEVFLFLGQSNMFGYNTDSSVLPESLHPDPHVQNFKNGRWHPFVLEKQVGPELSASGLLARSSDIGIIKLAVNSTSLFAWSPNWSVDKAELTGNVKSGFLFKKLLDVVSEAKRTKKISIQAIFWMQGETDAKYEIAAVQYKENLIELITALRSEFGDPELPFIFGLVDPPVSCCPNRDIVRKAQLEVANIMDRVEIVSIDDLSRQADQLHLDENGQIALGRRYAETYLDLKGVD